MIAFSNLAEFYGAREGERSPESDYGFQNWDDRIQRGCTGYSTRAFHPRAMQRHLQEVNGRLRVAHVQHTGDFYAVHAGSPGTVWLLGTVPDELPEPQVHGYFPDWAQSEGPVRPLNWFRALIATVVLDRTTGSRTFSPAIPGQGG